MQSAYIGKLMELAEKDQRILHILADSGTGFDEMFRRNFPERILNFGISEENMVSAAAGMATCGKIPFVYTAGAFLAYRSMEFIRDDICFQNLNVKIVGMGAGLSWSTLGPTHHTTEDISILRSLPNITILSPATPFQVSACVLKAYEIDGPVYIKIGMNKEKEFFDSNYSLPCNGIDSICQGEDLLILSSGSILEEADKVITLLDKDGIKAGLINVCSIKPFSDEIVKKIKSKTIVTLEEHNIYGGFGSIVAEIIAKNNLNIKLITIGLEDIFAKGYGTHKEVRKLNRLDGESIYKKIKEAL